MIACDGRAEITRVRVHQATERGCFFGDLKPTHQADTTKMQAMPGAAVVKSNICITLNMSSFQYTREKITVWRSTRTQTGRLYRVFVGGLQLADRHLQDGSPTGAVFLLFPSWYYWGFAYKRPHNRNIWAGEPAWSAGIRPNPGNATIWCTLENLERYTPGGYRVTNTLISGEVVALC